MPSTDSTLDYLGVLSQAMAASVRQRQQFWVLSALTDRSYEEGDRNHGFSEAVSFYERAGVATEALSEMRLGINGNLRDLCAAGLPPGHLAQRNKWVGQDLRFFDPTGVEQARAEIKPLYDLTLDKHYWTTAADYDKLVRVRGEGFAGRLFLGVFFIQLPNYCYGPGRWYGKPYTKRRDQYSGTWGIAAQYRKLRAALRLPPRWPDGDAPHVEDVGWPGGWAKLDEWFHGIHQPSGNWQFRPACLDGAAIAMAVWECP
jgi:hypothetical protein